MSLRRKLLKSKIALRPRQMHFSLARKMRPARVRREKLPPKNEPACSRQATTFYLSHCFCPLQDRLIGRNAHNACMLNGDRGSAVCEINSLAWIAKFVQV